MARTESFPLMFLGRGWVALPKIIVGRGDCPQCAVGRMPFEGHGSVVFGAMLPAPVQIILTLAQCDRNEVAKRR